MKTLDISYEIEPDAAGVINGVELAGEMIGYAATLLAPYVENCPACLDKLFSAIANQALEKVHTSFEQGYIYTEFAQLADGQDTALRNAVHLKNMRPLIASLLEGISEHEH